MQNRVSLSAESQDSTIHIANFAFDFDNSLFNSVTESAFYKALGNEQFWQFLQNARNNDYEEITKEEVEQQYNKIISELEHLSREELMRIEIQHESFQSKYKQKYKTKMKSPINLVRSHEEIKVEIYHEIRQEFAEIINRLDDRFFAMLIILTNQEIFEEYIALCKEKGIQHVILTVFSNRGDYEHDKLGMTFNGSPSAYTVMLYIVLYFMSRLPQAKVKGNLFGAGDIYGNKERGTSFKEIIEAHQTNTPITHKNFLYDQSKLSLQYLIAHDLEGILKQFGYDPKQVDMKNVAVTLCFSDDLKEVICKEEPPVLFPANTFVIKTLYNGHSSERVQITFQGTGEFDPNFRENIFSLFKCAGYSDSDIAARTVYDTYPTLDLPTFLAMRKPLTVGVINIDDYLQNINYENLIVDIIMKHGELLEQCAAAVGTAKGLSEDDEEALNQIVNASMSMRLDESLSLSRDLASSTGLLAASVCSEADKHNILMKAFSDADLSNTAFYVDSLNTIATKFPVKELVARLSIVHAPLLKVSNGALTDQAEVVRDLCVVKYNQLMVVLAERGNDLKEGVLFSSYRAIFKLLQEKLSAQACQCFHFATKYAEGDALYEHIVYIKENARFFSVSCGIDIVPVRDEPQQKAGYQFVPISIGVNKAATCYRDNSSCLMWSTSGSFSSLSIQENAELEEELKEFEPVDDTELEEFEYISSTPTLTI